jgi:hypothetical protein
VIFLAAENVPVAALPRFKLSTVILLAAKLLLDEIVTPETFKDIESAINDWV